MAKNKKKSGSVETGDEVSSGSEAGSAAHEERESQGELSPKNAAKIAEREEGSEQDPLSAAEANGEENEGEEIIPDIVSKKSGKKRKAVPAQETGNDEDVANGEAATSNKRARRIDKEATGASSKSEKKDGASKKNAKTSNKKKGKGNKKAPEVAAEAASEEENEEDDAEYEVKEIISHKVTKGVTLYQVRWKGYGPDDDTFEPEATLTACPEILKKYKEKMKVSTAVDKKSKKEQKSKDKKSKTGGKNKKKVEKVNENQEYEVEKILDYAEEDDGRQFLIRWKGFNKTHDTWEPEANLNCPEIIEKFLKRMKQNENISFKELREEPKKTKRFVNTSHARPAVRRNKSDRHSQRAGAKKRIYYGDSGEDDD